MGFLVQNKINVMEKLAHRDHSATVRTVIPFSSVRKRMVVAYKISEETVRVVVKGAPEEIMPMCTHQLDSQLQEVELS